MSGSGSLDTIVADGSFTTNVKAAGVTVQLARVTVARAIHADTSDVCFREFIAPIDARGVTGSDDNEQDAAFVQSFYAQTWTPHR